VVAGVGALVAGIIGAAHGVVAIDGYTGLTLAINTRLGAVAVHAVVAVGIQHTLSAEDQLKAPKIVQVNMRIAVFIKDSATWRHGIRRPGETVLEFSIVDQVDVAVIVIIERCPAGRSRKEDQGTD
jgi:hypothetical protein